MNTVDTVWYELDCTECGTYASITVPAGLDMPAPDTCPTCVRRDVNVTAGGTATTISPTDGDVCECCEQRLARWRRQYSDGGSFLICSACYADNATPSTDAPSRLY